MDGWVGGAAEYRIFQGTIAPRGSQFGRYQGGCGTPHHESPLLISMVMAIVTVLSGRFSKRDAPRACLQISNDKNFTRKNKTVPWYRICYHHAWYSEGVRTTLQHGDTPHKLR